MLKIKPKYLEQEIYSKMLQPSLTFLQYSLLLLNLNQHIRNYLLKLNLISLGLLMLKSKHTSNIRCKPIALDTR